MYTPKHATKDDVWLAMARAMRTGGMTLCVIRECRDLFFGGEPLIAHGKEVIND